MCTARLISPDEGVAALAETLGRARHAAMQRTAFSAGVFAFVALIAACAAEADPATTFDEAAPASEPGTKVPSPPPSSSSSSGSTSSSSSSGSIPAACSTFAQAGSPVTAVTSSDSEPVPSGGSIVDGTYVLTSTLVYTQAYPHGMDVGDLGSITLTVQSGTLQLLHTKTGGGELRGNGTYSVSGSTVTYTVTCGDPPPFGEGPSGYTATSDTIAYFVPSPIGIAVSTLTRQ